jgi:hypothetical protein
MAQTKRKRRNKHRGNAVGVVEARGRTSKPREGSKAAAKPARGRGAMGRQQLKPPTIQGSAIKALVGCVILFVFFRFLSKGTTTTGALEMCVVAFVLYTPIMYMTDKFIYNRKQRQLAGGAGGGAGGRKK